VLHFCSDLMHLKNLRKYYGGLRCTLSHLTKITSCNIGLKVMFNVFDRLIANRQTLAAYMWFEFTEVT